MNKENSFWNEAILLIWEAIILCTHIYFSQAHRDQDFKKQPYFFKLHQTTDLTSIVINVDKLYKQMEAQNVNVYVYRNTTI